MCTTPVVEAEVVVEPEPPQAVKEAEAAITSSPPVVQKARWNFVGARTPGETGPREPRSIASDASCRSGSSTYL
jgi:hypothetical protein